MNYIKKIFGFKTKNTVKRTYAEAVELSVKWWSKKAFQTPMNQNNGDDSENGAMSFLLMNMVSMNAKKTISTENIKKFEAKLTEILLEAEGKGKHINNLDVDYHPNKNLSDACQFAGVDPSCLPCKTYTFINDKNEVEGHYQYGGEWFIL